MLTRRPPSVDSGLDSIWEDALGVEGGNLEYSASKFLIAAIGRSYSTNYQHDYMPILVGAQGTGKSTFCRELVPHKQGWFVDGLDLSAAPKPESTEGGRRVSILKWPEGALLNLG